MFEKFKSRYFAVIIAVVTLFAVLLGYFYYFMNSAKATGADDAQTAVSSEDEQNIGKISKKGSRGRILDINGTVLAYDELSYDLQFTYDVSASASSDKANYTTIFEETIDILEAGGAKLKPTFFITKSKKGVFAYDTEGLSE